ncbi:hypothetical protein TRFO_40160 [Tritrichomonas foetus]|uniref:Uncharacterized protein n=1 Tax=Tritrichomonas foetus TaxID=1144522 RepID=A0A1J4J827_9EUKA|nr:hypothetical protein TRFO_40160 [Tritrichomonas foetus]|eukprot:OHS93573.1 hypothetical protein TRFO_40160 [Tritrichomonas foetus]
MRTVSRPQTSIFNRPIKRIQPTKQADIDFYVTNETPFGVEAPSYRIGGSRKEPRPPPQTPDPGQYSPSSAPKDTRIHHRITTSHSEIRDTFTTNIDYINHRIFPPRNTGKTIGERDGTTFYRVYDTPNCNYLPPISFDKPRISIAPKVNEIKAPIVPGPGAYNPSKSLTLPRNPAFSLTGPKYRDDWLNDTIQSPPPDQYAPKKVEKHMPYFTIGNRSRTKAGIKRNQLTVFPIGPFFVRLDDSITVREARNYCHSHPELKEIVTEIFDLISNVHPNDPKMALANYFLQFEKKKERPDNPFESKLIVHYTSKK